VVVYLVGALAAWKLSPTFGTRTVVAIGILFIAFATYGIGLEADLWCLVLLAAGLAIRAVMHRLNSRASNRAATTAATA
jgi:APA family basic amino acid/polyamine antiporter